MTGAWHILHGGSLGDLVLTIQLALRLPGVGERGGLRVISRTNPGELSACRPSILRQSAEGLGLHWLFGDQDDPPPPRLRELVHGARVLNALAASDSSVHRGLAALGPAELYSLDPRPRAGASCHITEQWRTQLESQGLSVPKCAHLQPGQPHLAVPAELRRRGRELLARCLDSTGTGSEAAPAPEVPVPVVLIHPGSGGRAKCWPLACFIEMARQLRSSAGGERTDPSRERKRAVVFLVGPVERETWAPSELTALRDEFRVLCCPEPDELVVLLAAAAVVVGNDGGPGHLAALLGRPTVTIFGPTSPTVWRPLGPRSQVLVGDPETHPDDWGIAPEQVVRLIGGWR